MRASSTGFEVANTLSKSQPKQKNLLKPFNLSGQFSPSARQQQNLESSKADMSKFLSLIGILLVVTYWSKCNRKKR